jgi:hypothetical protein
MPQLLEPQESDAMWFCSSTASAIHRGAVDDANEAAGLRINHATGCSKMSTSLSPLFLHSTGLERQGLLTYCSVTLSLTAHCH